MRSLGGRYKPQFVYQKTGVFLTDIVADTEKQKSLVMCMNDVRFMEAVDRINCGYGHHTVRR